MSWVKALLVRSHLRATGASSTLCALEEAQWQDPERLRASQDDRRRRLLLHAFRHVPYYRDVLSKARVVDASDRVHLERFRDIPLLDKRIIRAHFDDLTSDDLSKRRWKYTSSGGSTGRPIRVVRADEGEADLGILILFNVWAGHHPGDRQAVLWGVSRGGADQHASWMSPRGRLSQWVSNYILLDSYHVTPEKLHEHVRRINAWGPSNLYGYADFLYYLGRFVERERLPIHRPRSIVGTATPLYPHMREGIERVFGAPVFDRYGSGEVGLVAAQCERLSGLHVSTPTHYVEILRGDGTLAAPGEIGEIVVTPLANLGMPLIRYRTEDLGAWTVDPCVCGRSWPTISDLAGRAIDVFVTRDGGLISGGLFIKLVDEVNFRNGDVIDRYQIVQEDYDHVRVRLVFRAGDVSAPPPATVGEIRDGVAGMFRPKAEVTVEFPDTIETPESGKHRFAISKVPRTSGDFSDLFRV